jgi:ArsR family transcriptional regulator, virulence genes transcriptional regulator
MGNSVTSAILDRCEEVSQTLKSLSHPVRLKILCHVIDQDRSVNELTDFCEISQSAMSQFLGRMKDEGIIMSRREGTHVFYSLKDPKLRKLLKSIKEIYC